MGPFILTAIVGFLLAYAFYVLKRAHKQKTTRDTVNFLLGDHVNLTKEEATMHAAKKSMLEIIVGLYGNSFQEFPGRENLHSEEFLSLIAARFDEYVLKQVLKVYGTPKEIRVYALKKGGKSISIALAMIPAEGIIYEYFFYVPLNGYEIKVKEINEIIEISKVRGPEMQNSMFSVKRGELVPEQHNWEVYLQDAETNPVPVRIATNGKFSSMRISDIIELLRVKLFVEERQHVGIFGSPGTGKTSLWRAWVHALLPILVENYRIIFLTANQFEEWLEESPHWDWFNDVLKEDKKSVVIVDDIPMLNQLAWSTLLSLMDGKKQDDLKISFMLSWKASSKDELIKNIHDDFTAQSLIRRLNYMIELRPYSREEAEARIKAIQAMLKSPYIYERTVAQEILGVNTALSGAGNIAASEFFLGIQRSKPDLTEKEPSKAPDPNPQKEEEEERPVKPRIRKL